MFSPLIKNYVRGILTNRNLWFWGVAFMLFWLVLWASEFSGVGQATRGVLVPYVSASYGIVALYSISTLAISIAGSIYYSTHALAYGFHYTKLTPAAYLGTLIGSSSVLGLMLSVIMLVSTYCLYSFRFGLDVPPADPLGAIAVSALGGVFVMGLGVLLMLIVVNYIGLRSTSLVNFVPLLLAYGLGSSQIYGNVPTSVLYLSPYNAIQSLLFQAYSGTPAPVDFNRPSLVVLDWQYLLATLVIWIVALLIADALLLQRIRPRQIEEGRQV